MAMNESESGFVSGAAAGAYFGPFGALGGGILGAGMGMLSSRKRQQQEHEMYKANLAAAFEIGEGSYQGINQSRADIEAGYTSNLASERARFAASGASLEGATWNQVVGRQTQLRDEALDKIAEQEAAYKESEAYKAVTTEYESAFGYTEGGGLVADKIGTGVGTSQTDYFTAEQRANLRTWEADIDSETGMDPGATDAFMNKAYVEYYQAIAPTRDEFEMMQYGTDEQKQTIQTSLDQRIEQANLKFDDYLALDQLEKDYQRFGYSDPSAGETFKGQTELDRLRTSLGYTA